MKKCRLLNRQSLTVAASIGLAACISPAIAGDWSKRAGQMNRTDLPVFINNEGLNVAKDDLFENTVIYLTSHKRWSLNEKETAKMALFLKRGGTLWLDDCY